MIHLHPIPDANHICPYCQIRLEVKGWHIPGMRNLACLECSECNRKFLGDLPVGHGIYYPMLLEQESGYVHDNNNVPWFAEWLRDSFLNRIEEPVDLSIEEYRPIEKPIILNCIDTLYGHSLLKLLNAQFYLDHTDEDLILLIPNWLRWLVPDDVAAIWSVDIPLNQGTIWNDWLAQEIYNRVSSFEECQISVTFSHPHPRDYDIERFTHVKPFPILEWEERLAKPTITFISRNDRAWNYRSIRSTFKGIIESRSLLDSITNQNILINKTAHTLKYRLPELDFAIVGLEEPGGFPSWIKDLRNPNPDENVENIWCRRYADSHIVIGVHGSNMLLPSAHAGATIELLPKERLYNILQDILFKPGDIRETIFRHRFLSQDVSPDLLTDTIFSLLTHNYYMTLNMSKKFTDHLSINHIATRYKARLQRSIPKP